MSQTDNDKQTLSGLSRSEIDGLLATLSQGLQAPLILDETGAVDIAFDDGQQISLLHVPEVGALLCMVEIAAADDLEDAQLADLLTLNLATEWSGTSLVAMLPDTRVIVHASCLAAVPNDPASLMTAIDDAIMAAANLSGLLETLDGKSAGDAAPRTQMV